MGRQILQSSFFQSSNSSQAGHGGKDGQRIGAVEEEHRAGVALVRALAERGALLRIEGADRRSGAQLAEVVVEVPDVAERVADQLAAVDDAVLRQDELSFAGEAELLERSTLRLPREVLRAEAVHLPAGARR